MRGKPATAAQYYVRKRSLTVTSLPHSPSPFISHYRSRIQSNFRTERIVKIAQRYGVDEDACLDNVIHCHCQNTEDVRNFVGTHPASRQTRPFLDLYTPRNPLHFSPLRSSSSVPSPPALHPILHLQIGEPTTCAPKHAPRLILLNQQNEAVVQASSLVMEDGPFSVIIVDSVISHYRSEYSGRGELADRQQTLNKHLSKLMGLALEHNVAVVIVNQVMADPGAMSMFGPSFKPVGGHIVSHASTTRVMLKKGRGEDRIAKIYDSPCMPEAEATLSITDGGIGDGGDTK